MDKKIIAEIKKHCKEEKVDIVCDVDTEHANWIRNISKK
jgi:hypothetical protein